MIEKEFNDRIYTKSTAKREISKEMKISTANTVPIPIKVFNKACSNTFILSPHYTAVCFFVTGVTFFP